MAKAPRKAPKKPKKAAPKKYAKPLSLHPMSFEDAVDRLLHAKPAKRPTKKKSR